MIGMKLSKLVLIGLFMAGAIFKNINNRLTPDLTVEEVLKNAAEKKTKDQLDDQQMLSDMSAIESSSGRNTDHRTMASGQHKGETAVGQYGFMPQTVEDMGNRIKRDNPDDMPSLLRGLRDTTLSRQEIADIVAKEPDLEQAVAEKMLGVVKKRHPGDKERQSFAWEMGHNRSTESITPDILEDHPRTQKYRNLHKLIAKNKKE